VNGPGGGDPVTRADDLFDLLREVHNALERHGIWHCLIFGTLLGAIRDGEPISWDHDVDLLVRPADVAQILALNPELAAEDLGFWQGQTMASRLALNPAGIPFFEAGYLSIMKGGVARGELYAPLLFSDGVLRLYDLEREAAFWPQSSFPVYVVEELAAVTVRDTRFPVPAGAEKLLEWHYGPGWRTPYRSVRDGGAPRDGLTSHGDLAAPRLAAQIAWCEAQGWDRSVYRTAPAWPRSLGAAGPVDYGPRTATTSQSAWWHTLAEITDGY
jgi:LicD family